MHAVNALGSDIMKSMRSIYPTLLLLLLRPLLGLDLVPFELLSFALVPSAFNIGLFFLNSGGSVHIFWCLVSGIAESHA